PLPKHVRARLGTIRFRQGSPVATVRYSPDGKMLMSAGNDQSLRVWEAKTGKELFSFAGNEMNGSFNGFAGRAVYFRNGKNGWVLSPDGKPLATFDGMSSVKLWDITTGQVVRKVGEAQNRGNNFMAFSPDGKLFATIGNENKNNMYYGVIRLWEVSTGKEV